MPRQLQWRRSRGGLCHRADPSGFRFIEIDLQRTPLRKLQVEVCSGRLGQQVDDANHGEVCDRGRGAHRCYSRSPPVAPRQGQQTASQHVPGRGARALLEKALYRVELPHSLDPYLPPNGAVRTGFCCLTVDWSLDDAGEYRQRRLASSELPQLDTLQALTSPLHRTATGGRDPVRSGRLSVTESTLMQAQICCHQAAEVRYPFCRLYPPDHERGQQCFQDQVSDLSPYCCCAQPRAASSGPPPPAPHLLLRLKLCRQPPVSPPAP